MSRSHSPRFLCPLLSHGSPQALVALLQLCVDVLQLLLQRPLVLLQLSVLSTGSSLCAAETAALCFQLQGDSRITSCSKAGAGFSPGYWVGNSVFAPPGKGSPWGWRQSVSDGGAMR